MTEVANIWARYGVDIRASCENDERRDGAIKLVVVLADDRVKDPAAGALGSILFVDGVPRPTIFMHPKVIDGLVSSATVMGLSDRQLTSGFHNFIVGRVFGRALAHEIGHYLLRSPSHSAKGLMRALQFTPDLVGQDRELFALSADQVIRLDSLLTQITRADNPAEKVSGASKPAGRGIRGVWKRRLFSLFVLAARTLGVSEVRTPAPV